MGKMENQGSGVNQDLQAQWDHGESQDSREKLVMWVSQGQRVKLAL